MVADNAGDMAVKAFKDAELPDHVSVVRDGKEAFAFLRKEGVYLRAPRPEFILLDLNMLKKGCHEVLREVKTDGALKTVPFIVLTTSVAPTDIVQDHDLYANGYIQKPADYDEFLELISPLDTLWFSVEQLPTATEEATA